MKIQIINSDNKEELNIFSLSENELKRLYEPEQGLFIAESPNVIIRAIADGYEPVKALVENSVANHNEELMNAFNGFDITVFTANERDLSVIKGFEMTRGALCIFRRRTYRKAVDICSKATNIAILEDVMNPTNLGAIFRSAAALNIDAILLTKGCSDPLYRRAARVSVGNVFQVPWTFIDDIEDSLKALNDTGFTSVAMALDDKAISISDERLKRAGKLAVVLGTEGYGLHKTTIDACDYTVMIPMSNSVDSLNVAAASAVAFWELCAR